jgi:hypothetical protein
LAGPCHPGRKKGLKFFSPFFNARNLCGFEIRVFRQGSCPHEPEICFTLVVGDNTNNGGLFLRFTSAKVRVLTNLNPSAKVRVPTNLKSSAKVRVPTNLKENLAFPLLFVFDFQAMVTFLRLIILSQWKTLPVIWQQEFSQIWVAFKVDAE